MKQLFIRKPD